MPRQKTITFRSQIKGDLSDLVQDEGLTCQHTVEFMSALAGGLHRYRDEGVEMSPTILYSTHVDGVLNGFPGAVKYLIGDVEASPVAVKKILKDCAPLARGGWLIFVERTEALRLKFGVFHYNTLPTTLPLKEAVGLSSAEFCLLVTKTSPNTVEIRGARGSVLSMVFSTTREELAGADTSIDDFARDCCAATAGSEEHGQFFAYFSLVLDKILSDSHGTILICCAPERFHSIGDLQDGILLSPKLDFRTAFVQYKNSSSAESLMKLQSLEDLLIGIFMCDGAVAFDDSGSAIAYRVFYRPVSASTETARVSDGGARRRAFEGMRSLLGSGVRSALFRSQDGLTIYAKENS